MKSLPSLWRARRLCLVMLSLGAWACAPTASGPAPAAAPPKPVATAPPALPPASPAPKPAASPAAKPAASPVAKGVSVAEWERIVAEAKREGRLAMIGPAGTDVREGLAEAFQKVFPEIQVDYSGMAGSQVAPKLLAERDAGQFQTDVSLTGTTTMIESLIPAGALAPIRPFLVGPEAANEPKWRGGAFNFGDDARVHNLVFGNRVQIPFEYNPTVVSPSEFKSWKDLLNPKWKGKIAMRTPTQAGAGLDVMTFWYTSPSLGKEFMQQFFRQQDVLILNDDRQILDLVARGSHPISIGPSGVQAYELKTRGLPIELFPGEALQEGSFVTASNGTIGVADRAPHPNAVKVFLNYLTSRDGQLEWSQKTGLSSLRLDVPRDHIPEFLVPKEGVKYQENYTETYVKLKEEIVEYLKTLLPS